MGYASYMRPWSPGSIPSFNSTPTSGEGCLDALNASSITLSAFEAYVPRARRSLMLAPRKEWILGPFYAEEVEREPEARRGFRIPYDGRSKKISITSTWS